MREKVKIHKFILVLLVISVIALPLSIFSTICSYRLASDQVTSGGVIITDKLSIGKIPLEYIIYKNENSICARNELTGITNLQSNDPVEVIQKVLEKLNENGGGVLSINSSITINRQLVLKGIANIEIKSLNMNTLNIKFPDGKTKLASDAGAGILILGCNNITFNSISFFYGSDCAAKFMKFRFLNYGITIRDCTFESSMPPTDPQPEDYFISHDGIALSPTDGAAVDNAHVIDNFTFEGNYASGSAGDFVAIHNVKNFVIRNNTFVDAAARKWEKMSGDISAILGGSSITITGENGIIEGNSFIRDKQPETFFGNYVRYMGGVLLTYAGNRVPKNITIDNNFFYQTSYGVSLDPYCENINIYNNEIYVNASKYGWEEGITVRYGSKNINITSNYIFKPYQSGIAIADKSSKVLVKNNTIEFAQRMGINSEIGSVNVTIGGNLIKNSGQDTSLLAQDARRSGIRICGINVIAASNVIWDDQLNKTQTFGIAIERDAVGILVSNNTSKDNIQVEIRNRGTNVTIQT